MKVLGLFALLSVVPAGLALADAPSETFETIGLAFPERVASIVHPKDPDRRIPLYRFDMGGTMVYMVLEPDVSLVGTQPTEACPPQQ